jgi:hypothetical protein
VLKKPKLETALKGLTLDNYVAECERYRAYTQGRYDELLRLRYVLKEVDHVGMPVAEGMEAEDVNVAEDILGRIDSFLDLILKDADRPQGIVDSAWRSPADDDEPRPSPMECALRQMFSVKEFSDERIRAVAESFLLSPDIKRQVRQIIEEHEAMGEMGALNCEISEKAGHR